MYCPEECMEKVRVGIIGLGWVAQVVHIPQLLRMPEAEIVAVCDRDRARVRLVGEKFGFRNMYADTDALMERSDVDAVIVATSTDAHKDITLAALKAGKDVLVEKPIGRDYAEALEMATAARELKRKLMVGMNHRFRPDTMILKSMIEGKELGKVYYTRVGWLRKYNAERPWILQKEKSGGGVFIDLGIVMLDMALWMMGYPGVKRVNAVHYNQKTRKVEDTSLVNLVLKNGASVNIEVSWSMALDDDVSYCYIHGTEGSASLNPFRINKELHGSLVNLAPAKLDTPHHMFNRSYENELRHFLGAVKDIHPVVSTAEEAVERMRIVDAVYKSVKRGREVILP